MSRHAKTGLEPASSLYQSDILPLNYIFCFEDRSSLLHVPLERRTDLETVYSAWKADILAFELTAHDKTQDLHSILSLNAEEDTSISKGLNLHYGCSRHRFIDSLLVNYVYRCLTLQYCVLK